jgi:hypothetical protein
MYVEIFDKTIWIRAGTVYSAIGAVCGFCIFIIFRKLLDASEASFFEKQKLGRNGAVISDDLLDSPRLSLSIGDKQVEIAFTKLSKGTFRWERPLLFSAKFNIDFPPHFQLEVFPVELSKLQLREKENQLPDIRVGNEKFDGVYRTIANDESLVKKALNEQRQVVLLEEKLKSKIWAMHIKDSKCVFYLRGAGKTDSHFQEFLNTLTPAVKAFSSSC